MNREPPASFLASHEFLIRRLHSLSGLVPVGAYLCVHLLTNASVLDGVPTFQNAVFNIHKLGTILPLIEWTFIFIPILFHGLLGIVIIRGGLPNGRTYRYASNIRYSLQRTTGMIAFVFILWHVFHMHGWFHADWWVHNVAKPLNGALFKPYNGASTAGAALQQHWIVPLFYSVGMLACVYHLANGIWTMGITWGVWVTPRAQRSADYVCAALGIGLALVGMSSVVGFSKVNVQQAETIEDEMYRRQSEARIIQPNEHKRTRPTHDEHDVPKKTARITASN